MFSSWHEKPNVPAFFCHQPEHCLANTGTGPYKFIITYITFKIQKLVQYWILESSGLGVPTLVTNPFLISGHCVFSSFPLFGDAQTHHLQQTLGARPESGPAAAPMCCSKRASLCSADAAPGEMSVKRKNCWVPRVNLKVMFQCRNFHLYLEILVRTVVLTRLTLTKSSLRQVFLDCERNICSRCDAVSLKTCAANCAGENWVRRKPFMSGDRPHPVAHFQPFYVW